LIGKLIYLMVTRLDITFVVGVLSRFMHQLRETYWLAALRVLAYYIKSCPEKGLMYRKHGHAHISGYSDSGHLVIEGIESLLMAITPLLEEIWWLG